MTGKSNEAARARMFLQVATNPGKSWGYLCISVEGSRGSVQSKAPYQPGPAFGSDVWRRSGGPGKILPAIGVA